VPIWDKVLIFLCKFVITFINRRKNKTILDMKNPVKILLFALMVLMLGACGQKGEYPFATKYLPVKLVGSEKWSIVNIDNGEVVAKDAYKNEPSPVVDDIYYVTNDDQTVDYYSVSDPKKPINKEHFASATIFSDDGFAVASKRGGPLTVINAKCEAVKALPNDVEICSMFTNGRASYRNDQGRFGYIDVKGDTVIKPIYANAFLFMHSNMAVVSKEANDSVYDITAIDKDGKELFSESSLQYGIINPYFVNDVLPLQKGDSVVCINKEGKEVPGPNKDVDSLKKAGYIDVSLTPGNYYIVSKNGKYGLVDAKNNVLIKTQYDRLVDLSNDRYVAINNNECTIVDKSGKQIGKCKFVDFQPGPQEMYAQRGFVDTNLVAAQMMQLFSSDMACGARQGSTLMDLNGLVGNNAANYVNTAVVGQANGPYLFRFFFNNYIASQQAGMPPTFNYDAKLQCVAISLDVHQCDTKTEGDIVSKISGALGTSGFIYGDNGIFTSDSGTAISLGYADGVVNLFYYMDKASAQPLPRKDRNS
jgi:predicted small lipoprotein YifL